MLCERDRHHSGMIVRLKRASNRVGQAQRWPDEIDAVGETNLGQHLRIRLRSEVLENPSTPAGVVTISSRPAS